MPEYDAINFSPPAPVALVSLAHPETGRAIHNIPMLIDTGADVTMVPREPLQAIDVETLPQQYTLQGFDGGEATADSAQLSLRFLGKTFRGQFLLLDQPLGILGRNVLNRLVLVLDGPNLRWQESGR